MPMPIDDKNPVIARLIAWGMRREDVRAIVLSSSRTNPNVQDLVDRLSDYDVDIIISRSAREWYEDRSWITDFGDVLVGFCDEMAQEYGIEIFGSLIVYDDGTKIDYTIMPVEIFRQVAAEPELRGGWDDGYQVLLDKDQLAAGMKSPTHQEFIPSPPTRQEYLHLIDLFFMETTYVAKNLWRDELIFWKHCLDHEMKETMLVRMLEWYMEIDYHWSVRLGVLGRQLKKRLPPDLWTELERTYVGAGNEENWAALFRTIDLFRKVALHVGRRLGYPYPHDLDSRVMAYLQKIKEL